MNKNNGHIKSPQVLVLPSFYPMEEDFPRGSFFEEQTKLLQAAGTSIAVVFNENRSITSFRFSKLRRIHFQKQFSHENGVPVLRRMQWNIIPTRFLIGSGLWIDSSVRLIRTHINTFGKPELMHVHAALYAGFAAQKVMRETGIPYLITEHSSSIGLKEMKDAERKKLRGVYEDAAVVITVSTFLKNLLVEKLDLKEERIRVIPNFIDTSFYKPDASIVKTGKVIFTACYHQKNKRLDRLIEAFAMLHREDNSLRLIIGGEGPETENLKQLVSSLGLGTTIEFPGFLSRQQMKEFLDRSSVLVSSSDFETFGVILIEAMAMGVPVVATDSGGPSDIITETNGVLVPRSIDGLASGLNKVLKNLPGYSSVAIRDFVLEHFSEKSQVIQYQQLYSEIINRTKGL